MRGRSGPEVAMAKKNKRTICPARGRVSLTAPGENFRPRRFFRGCKSNWVSPDRASICIYERPLPRQKSPRKEIPSIFFFCIGRCRVEGRSPGFSFYRSKHYITTVSASTGAVSDALPCPTSGPARLPVIEAFLIRATL